MNYRSVRKMLFLTAVLAVGFLGVIFWSFNPTEATQNAELLVKKENSQFVMSADDMGEIYRTPNSISNQKMIQIGNDSPARIVLWEENNGAEKTSHYAISLDGKTISRATQADYTVDLRYKKFDPLTDAPSVPDSLASRNDGGEATYIVQFVTQPLEEYREQIRDFGAKDFIYLPNYSHIVTMNDETRARVQSLPFVRWVGRYEPAYKMEEYLTEKLMTDAQLPTLRYNIMALERGTDMQGKLATAVNAVGGKVDSIIPQGYRMEATLSPTQLLAIANKNEVLFIDRWSAPESDMDIVRQVSGANFIESTLGFTGQGVRAEVMDGGLRASHVDFNSGLPPLLHGTINVDSHGTATYGINFARGTANPMGRGIVPDAQGIIAGYPQLTNRYTHTAQLLQDPYRAVYQSNSWGSAQTTAYTTISAEMDDILFINDFTLLNSQSNTGNQLSRPQAWAKNVVSIGGISHFNTATFTDDRWTSASVGPAADGRMKPELAHFYDATFTTDSSSDTAYTSNFGGTSGATPITAGLFGIFFQMWHNGLFHNPTGASVFESRPHMTTAKAVMINTAVQWDMSSANRERNKQGFGRADLTNLYNLRNKMMIVDESDVLTNLQSKSYTVNVPAGGTDPFKATMVYADPKGNPAATRTRINDLSLKVTAPDGTIYWGNNGLTTGMWSTSGGTSNIIDTTENVFIQTPQAGTWKVEVIASEIVQDARLETPSAVDADYALVVSGIQTAPKGTEFDYDGDGKSDLSVFRPGEGTWYIQQSTAGFISVPFGLVTDRLVPADYDGDGKTDIAVFRHANNTWYLLRSTAGFTAVTFGVSSDVPVPGDYDGDGKADIAVFRSGTWYVLGSSAGFFGTTFGTTSDKPVAGDYDGDGKTDFAVFRPSNGTWYLLRSTAGFTAFAFGIEEDLIVPADYDGDGKTDPAVFRDGVWYLLRSTAGFTGVQFGVATDVPVPADYDGDGKADIAVYRTGQWYLLRSTSGFAAFNFGINPDKATQSAYIR